MPPRLYRAKLKLAHKRFEAVLKRTLKPGRSQTFDFESPAAAIATAMTHLGKFSDGEAEVWEREADSAAPTRMIWPEKTKKKAPKVSARKPRR